MAVCVSVDESGYVRQTVEAVQNCTSHVLVDASQYSLIVEPVLNSSEIASVFTWGFASVVVLGYFSGYAVGIAKTIINKL